MSDRNSPRVQGKILVELFKARERCREAGFSDDEIAASMRQAPIWFESLREKEAGK
jgi:hypothetical protein